MSAWKDFLSRKTPDPDAVEGDVSDEVGDADEGRRATIEPAAYVSKARKERESLRLRFSSSPGLKRTPDEEPDPK